MPATPKQLANLAKTLRYFEYTPPSGGFGGEWDTLTCRLKFTDDADLARILGTLGLPGAHVPGPTHVSAGEVRIEGARVDVSFLGKAPFLGEQYDHSIELLCAVYVTPEHIAAAARIEAWLDAHGLVAVPARVR